MKNSSARGEVYENVTKVNVCELPYCKVTSCENELIAEQAAEIWPHFHKFVDHLMSLASSKQPKNSKSYDGLSMWFLTTFYPQNSNLLKCYKFSIKQFFCPIFFLHERIYFSGWWKSFFKKRLLPKLLHDGNF